MNKKFLFCAVFFSSCAQLTFQDYQNVADLIFQENEQLRINSEYIENRNFSFAKINIGNKNSAILSLVTIENDIFTWISANGEKVITRNGRIIESHGLDYDFITLNSTEFQFEPRSYELIVQLENPRAIITQSNTISLAGDEPLFLDKQYQTELFIENFLSSPINWKGKNYFWIDKSTGLALRTHQHVHPYEESIELEFYYIFR
tara:strand:- start:117 stop:728 length:612 start_codon:yes stop_codon:yes gene_type:complete